MWKLEMTILKYVDERIKRAVIAVILRPIDHKEYERILHY